MIRIIAAAPIQMKTHHERTNACAYKNAKKIILLKIIIVVQKRHEALIIVFHYLCHQQQQLFDYAQPYVYQVVSY